MKNEIRFIITVCLLVAAAALLPAQTAAELEAVLHEPVISCAQAARFVLASAGGAASMGTAASEGGEFAFEQAAAMGCFPKKAAPDDFINLGVLSFLCMKAFGIKGGLMYAIFPGPHYAFRTMVARSLIQGAADPAMTVNGERFFHILGNVLSAAGGEE